MTSIASIPGRSRVSFPFILLLNFSLLAFYTTTAFWEPLAAIAVISLSAMVQTRLPRSATLAAALRLGLFTLVVLHIGIPQDSFPQWYMKPSYTTLIGGLLAAESALRAWEPGGGYLSGDPRGIMFFVSALLMAAAANTAERYPMNWLAPGYVVLAIYALRSFEHRPFKLSLLQLMRGGAAMLVLAGGLRLVRSINQYDDALNALVERLLYTQRRPMQIGMSPSPRVGWIFNPLQQSDRVMLVAGSLSERYLAGAAFDEYAAQQWGPSITSRRYVSADPRAIRTDNAGTRLTFTRVGSDLNLLPMPLNTVSVESAAGVEQDDFGNLRHTEENLSGSSSQYTAVVANDDRTQGPLTIAITDVQRKTALQLPDNFNPAAAQLARQLTEGKHDDQAVIRLLNHLRSKHGYSLRYRPGGPEPISNFILSDDSAHCVFFASSLVMMCRASGIPARVVTGYYAWEFFSEDTLVVRSRDAHAWAEVWIDGMGWLTFDATPAGGRPDALNQPTSWIQRTWERISDWPGLVRDWISQFSEFTLVSVVIGLASVLFLAFLSRVIWLRYLAAQATSRQRYAERDRQLTRAAKRFNRWLIRNGHRCDNALSWRQCLGTSTQAQPFLDAYDDARFGEPSPQKTSDVLQLLKSLETQRVSESTESTIKQP